MLYATFKTQAENDIRNVPMTGMAGFFDGEVKK